MRSLGDAFIEVHGDTDPFERDVQRGVREGAEDAEDDAREAGGDLGEAMGEGLGDSLREQGPRLAREIETGLSRQKIRTKVTVQFDKDNNVVRKWVSTITDEISDAFDRTDGPTSFFQRIQTGFADAIGAGFNVSGRSPLIALLVPLVGVIAALILGALQAVNALVAVLVTLPALIGAIGLQVGIVALAFDGMGEAIQGAFAAKNAKELALAIGDLAPSAQTFVRQLLPLRDFFKELRFFVQENFFSGLGTIFGTGGALTPLMGAISGLGPTARSLGEFFHQLASFFGSPTFVRFVELLLPSIDRFLEQNGPALTQFLDGLTNLSITALPFLDKIGSNISTVLLLLGDFFNETAKSPTTGGWLDSMEKTLLSIEMLIVSALNFITVLLSELDKAGGRKIIDEFAIALDRLAFFLSTPVGQKALEGLVNGALIAIAVFTGLIVILLAGIATIQFFAEAIEAFFQWVWEGIKWLWGKITGIFSNADDEIKSALTIDLTQVGANIVASLINGIRSQIPSLRSIMTTIAATVRSFWPFSPAKEGPLSGSGDPLLAGQNIIHRLAEGITAGSNELGSVMNQSTSNIVFGPGAVRVGFEGALPTTEQAAQVGQAVGQGALSVLARNTRLAVRSA